MKRFLGILVLGLILFATPTNISFAIEGGYGELKLSNRVLDVFVKYIKGRFSKAPYIFAVALDGIEYQYWYCSAGLNNCRGGSPKAVIKDCEKYSRKYGSGAKCAVFAYNRTIKWNNGINKNTKINSKWSDEEITAKLTELGFLGAESESFVTKKTEKKKEEKKAETKETTQTQQVAKKMEGSSLKVFRYGVSGQKLYAIYINFIESEKCDYVGPFLSTKCTWFLKENILHFDLSNAIFNNFSESAEKYYYGSFSVDLTQDKLIVKNNLNQKIFAELNKKPTQTQIAKKELTIKPKEEVKQTDDGNNITQQLKDLNEMYKSGALTKEEFTKAKKKLLN